MRALINKNHPDTYLPSRNHGVDDHGTIHRLYFKPTRAERKVRVAQLKAQRAKE